MKIGVLGAGAYGTALGAVMRDNGHDVYYYDPAKEHDDLPLVLDSDYLFLCIPTEAVLSLSKDLPKDKPLVITSKGFLSDKPFYSFGDYMVLSGAGFADDIKAKKGTRLTVTDNRIIELLQAEYLSFDSTDDRLGVLMCGALKNAYAILAGYLNLTHGSDDWWSYVEDVSEEIRALLAVNGADSATFDLACGRSDLELTCGLPSRNFEYGQILRSDPGAKPDKTVEGLTALNGIRHNEIIVPETANHLKELLNLKLGGD